MKFLALMIVYAALWLGSPAHACMAANDYYAYIHSTLPRPLPRGVIVAHVEMEDLPRLGDYRHHLLINGIRARVLRMVQGDYGGESIVVRPVKWTSCDSVFANGRAGILVAIPRRFEEGTLIVDPIKVWSASGYRLPDGYQVPPEEFQRAALPARGRTQQQRRVVPTALLFAGVALLLAISAFGVSVVLRRRKRRFAAP